MQLPPPSANYMQRVRFGRYVARRAKRAGLEKLGADIARITLEVKQAGRAWDDADEPEQDALADRDAADDALDLLAQQARNTLAGRDLYAVTTEPYTRIFPDGVAYYTAAPLDQQRTRYTEFVERLEAHLPATDALCKSAPKAVRQALDDFAAATDALEASRRASGSAGTALDQVTERWERQLEKAYGALVVEFGRARAERFFPKARASRSKSAGIGGRDDGNTPPREVDRLPTGTFRRPASAPTPAIAVRWGPRRGVRPRNLRAPEPRGAPVGVPSRGTRDPGPPRRRGNSTRQPLARTITACHDARAAPEARGVGTPRVALRAPAR